MAQNTAFNKNFGKTAGTVVEGGTLGSNAYTSTAYLPLSGGIVNGFLKVGSDNNIPYTTDFGLFLAYTHPKSIMYIGDGTGYSFSISTKKEGVSTDLISIADNGNLVSISKITAASYTATSLPVFENNAAASSLAVGQFYRTSIGVLMVKF